MLDRAIGILGVALALIFGLWSLAPDGWPKMPVWLTLTGIGAGILLIGFAGGLLIADQRNDRAAVPTEATSTKPEFRLVILGGNVFAPTEARKLTGIAVGVRIWNTGEPSIAPSWKMRIVPNGRDAIEAQTTAMPTVLNAQGDINSAVLRSSDSIETKTLKSKVGKDPIEGKLLVYVELPQTVVVAPTTIWEVSVKDLYEKETTATFLVGDHIGR